MEFVLNRIGTLLQFDIKPILVFDGRTPPIKQRLVSERKSSKREVVYENRHDLDYIGACRAQSVTLYHVYTLIEVIFINERAGLRTRSIFF